MMSWKISAASSEFDKRSLLFYDDNKIIHKVNDLRITLRVKVVNSDLHQRLFVMSTTWEVPPQSQIPYVALRKIPSCVKPPKNTYNGHGRLAQKSQQTETGSISSCVAVKFCISAWQHWQADNIRLSCHWLAHISIPSRPGGSLPRINRPKTTMGSYSKHQALTFAQHPQRRGKAQMFQLCGSARRM